MRPTTQAQARTSRSLYEQLEGLPEGLTGEIRNGQLHVQPRPAARHIRAAARLDRIIVGAARVAVAPFEAASINLGSLWVAAE